MPVSGGTYSTTSSYVIAETCRGAAIEVPLDVFFEVFLPPLRDDIDLDALMRDGVEHDLLTSTGRMWGYEMRTPPEMSYSTAFAPLQSCASRLAHSVRRHTSRLAYLSNPRNQWLQDDKDTQVFPDACLLVDQGHTLGASRGRKRRKSSPKAHACPWSYRSASDSSSGSASSSTSNTSSSSDRVAAIDWKTIAVSGAYVRHSESEDQYSVCCLFSHC